MEPQALVFSIPSPLWGGKAAAKGGGWTKGTSLLFSHPIQPPHWLAQIIRLIHSTSAISITLGGKSGLTECNSIVLAVWR
jgi:hypothetical protein